MSRCDLLWVISAHKVTQPFKKVHSGHWGINPPSKTPPPFLAKPPPLNQQTVQAPLFRESPPMYWFFVITPPLPEKSDPLVNPKNIKVFHP